MRRKLFVHRMENSSKRRSGAVTVLCLVTLLIFSGMISQYVRRVLLERRQFRNEVLSVQAEQLAETALRMARTERTQDPTWVGMVWELPSGIIHQTNSARVVIEMQDDVCKVIARYPTNRELPVQITRTRKLLP
jgi:type II secretory pathway component PulK